MKLYCPALYFSLAADAISRNDPDPEPKLSDLRESQNDFQVNYVIEPADDQHKIRTSRGPGGYTDDGETWSCLNDCDMEFGDCDSIQTTIEDMGGPDGWWWIPSSTGCNSWQHRTCKATFCPLDTTEDDNGNPIQEDMIVSTPTLAKQLELLSKICAEDGRRAYMKADNGSWEFWLAERGWEVSSPGEDEY